MSAEKCPHCKELLRDLWDHDWDGREDEEVETECGWCEKPIVIKRRIRTTYTIELAAPSNTEESK